MVRKSSYQEVGGLNEADLAIAFNDVDFCLKLVTAGYRNVFTPYALLYHHESLSRGPDDTPEKHARFMHEFEYMKRTWGGILQNDNAYNPNLTLEFETFALGNNRQPVHELSEEQLGPGWRCKVSMMNNRSDTLRSIFVEHKGKVSDKWSMYLDEYNRLFDAYRDLPVRLLEIGIQNGGSLEIWSKFFPNAVTIVGCDNNPVCAQLKYEDPKIAVVAADANTDEAEQLILGLSSAF